MKDEIGVKVACFLLAIFFLNITFSTLKKILLYFRLKSNGQKTIGQVIDIDSKPITIFSRGGNAPVIEFKTTSEESIKNIPENITYSNPSFYEIGEECILYYELSNPIRFVIKRNTELALLLIVLLVMTGFFILSLLGLLGIIK